MRANAGSANRNCRASGLSRALTSTGAEQHRADLHLHDGPYANRALHMGHALNQVLKDVINKYQVLRGRRVRYVPGWDCHGLPIELKVLQSMDQEQRKALTPIKLRKKAAAYARKQVDGQMKGFQRWGIWADWEQPYLTLKEYESAQIRVFGDGPEGSHLPGPQTGALESELRTALPRRSWSIRTATSPSVYAAFLPSNCRRSCGTPSAALASNCPMKQALARPCRSDLDNHALTLPANLAVSVNERLDYALVDDGSGRLLLVAADLIDTLTTTLSALSRRTSVKGALAGLIYRRPCWSTSPVVIGGE